MIELRNTINMMISEDYKERFKAEYYQLNIRIYKLEFLLDAWDNEELEYTPNCPRDLYDIQMRAMEEYRTILRARAKIENIELD